MTLEKGLVLYHGSYTKVIDIDLKKCTKGKDFGIGFYLTTDLNQACNFLSSSVRKAFSKGLIKEEQKYGYVSSFRFDGDPEDYSYYEFNKADNEWLNFVSLNRRTSIANSIINKINPEVFKAEIISGKIANDTTNPVITAYLNGLYGDISQSNSANIAISLLLPEKLKDQYCFLSQRAIKGLTFIKVEKYEF